MIGSKLVTDSQNLTLPYELEEIQTVFQGLLALHQTYVAKADPVLVNDLLARPYDNLKSSPFYMTEVFKKPKNRSDFEATNKVANNPQI